MASSVGNRTGWLVVALAAIVLAATGCGAKAGLNDWTGDTVTGGTGGTPTGGTGGATGGTGGFTGGTGGAVPGYTQVDAVWLHTCAVRTDGWIVEEDSTCDDIPECAN